MSALGLLTDINEAKRKPNEDAAFVPFKGEAAG
jgi:hypothetical protein